MPIRPAIAELDELARNPILWAFDREAQRYSYSVDGYTLEVRKVTHHGSSPVALDRGNINAVWSLSHEREGVIMNDALAIHAADAKKQCIEFTRARILSQLVDA